MNKLASIILAVALVGAGTVVGWEARNWHIVIVQWYEKAAAYDMVGDEIMHKIMVEIAKQRILQERESQAPQRTQQRQPGNYYKRPDGKIVI